MATYAKISSYTKEEAISLLTYMSEIFEVVRFVDVTMTHQFVPNDTMDDLIEANYSCYAVWNKEHRCENCVSARAYSCKSKMTKFEFVNDEIYYVVAKYVEIEETPFMLEMVTRIDDDILFGAYGKENFVETIINYNNTLYIDALTHAYNRHYFDTQLKNLSKINAVAMVDVDHFKDVNDTYGHDAGDSVLKEIATALMSAVRTSDSIVRYGGDEFLILFEQMKPDILPQKLESIRKKVEQLSFEEYPDIRPSISVGGICCDQCDKAAMKQADLQLYEAKKYRNKVCCGE